MSAMATPIFILEKIYFLFTVPDYHNLTQQEKTNVCSFLPGSTTVGKVTVGTTTQQPRSSEHAATSRETAQSLPESTYFSTDETPKLSTITYYTTPEHDSTVPGLLT